MLEEVVTFQVANRVDSIFIYPNGVVKGRIFPLNAKGEYVIVENSYATIEGIICIFTKKQVEQDKWQSFSFRGCEIQFNFQRPEEGLRYTKITPLVQPAKANTCLVEQKDGKLPKVYIRPKIKPSRKYI